MSRSGSLVVERLDETARITIDRPDARNALRREDKLRLAETLFQLAEDGARAIIITGSGDRAFCAGTDIKEMSDFTVSDGIAMLQAEARMYDAVMQVPIPVIAEVNGVALGAGCVLAYCCDLAIGATTAAFGQPEVRNGVPAPLQAALLPRIIGLGRTRWLLYTGEVIDADAALREGLIGEVVDRSVLPDRAMEIAHRIGQLPRNGVALQKRIVDSWIRDPFEAAVSSSVYVAASAFESDEPQIAIRRFLKSDR